MVDILIYIFRYVYVYLPEDPSSNARYYVSIYELEVFGGLPSADPPTMPPGPRLNIKTILSRYGDFHVKDKTAVRTSYL